MYIIFEAPDCAGKTTTTIELEKALSESLLDESKFTIVKGSSFEHSKCSNEELFEKFKEMLTDEHIIFDRFIYSNEVYASLYEDFSILTDEQRRFIEREIKGNAIVIYLEAELETLKQRIESRGDEYVTADRLASIQEKYAESISKIEGLPILKFNTTYTSTEEIVSRILEELAV